MRILTLLLVLFVMSSLNVSECRTLDTAAIPSWNNIEGVSYQVDFKETSLETFVNNTRMQNLTVSFGVLLLLGINVVLFVIFFLRSKELADQQMLFVAGISHELRSPINVIRSAAENLSDGIVKNDKRRLEYAQLMLKEGRRLSNMVDQIMEFSGIQSGKKEYQMAEIRISNLIEHIKKEAEPLLKGENIQIEYPITVDTNKIVYADFEGLSIALMNIIHNAIKFSGDANLIKFCIHEVKYRGKEGTAFTIQDYGIGIPADEQKKIFKPFYRGSKPVDDHIKGNGIGLSLVHKIVSAHHGEVSVNSLVNEGSVFKVIIPGAKSHG